MNRKTLLIVGGLLLVLSGGFLTLTPQGKKLMNTISETGLNFLKSLEGFSSKAYYDVKGWSIGFGHFMGANKTYDNISVEQALELLRGDLQWVENTIKKYVKVPLNQNQHDALVSFIYNIGQPNFVNSTTLKKINAGDYNGGANAMLLYNKSRKNGQLEFNQVLADRRAKEKQLFLS